MILTPLSTIFQLYHDSLWRRKPEYLEKTTDLRQVTDKLYHIIKLLYWIHPSPWVGFKLTTLVGIVTDCKR